MLNPDGTYDFDKHYCGSDGELFYNKLVKSDQTPSLAVNLGRNRVRFSTPLEDVYELPPSRSSSPKTAHAKVDKGISTITPKPSSPSRDQKPHKPRYHSIFNVSDQNFEGTKPDLRVYFSGVYGRRDLTIFGTRSKVPGQEDFNSKLIVFNFVYKF